MAFISEITIFTNAGAIYISIKFNSMIMKLMHFIFGKKGWREKDRYREKEKKRHPLL